MSTEERPMSYEECLKEVQALLKDPDYDNWASTRQKNSGAEIKPEMFQMSDEAMQKWAGKIDRLAFPQ